MSHMIFPTVATTHSTLHCRTSVCLFQKVEYGISAANLKMTELHSPPCWQKIYPEPLPPRLLYQRTVAAYKILLSHGIPF